MILQTPGSAAPSTRGRLTSDDAARLMRPPVFRPRPLTLTAALAVALPAFSAQAQETSGEALVLRPVKQLHQVRRQDTRPAMALSADRITSELDQTSTAEGDVQLRYGNMLLKSKTLRYDYPRDLATAEGDVELNQNGAVLRGPKLELFVDRFEGQLESPTYFFATTGGSGSAKALHFLGDQRMRADEATYSTCPVSEVGERKRDWELVTSSLKLDFDTGEGVATNAVVRFLGVPILAAPSLSFPLGDQPKSGFLPPNVNIDNRSGFEFGQPFYWSIAPNRDATISPFIMTRRGAGVDSEFRYLEPSHRGTISYALLPHDQVTGRSRWDLRLNNSGDITPEWRYNINTERVSDNDYWKDMRNRMTSQTPRLLSTDVRTQRDFNFNWGELQTYARVQHWQPLQVAETQDQFLAPYQRSPQIGMRLQTGADESVLAGYLPTGRRARLEGGVEVEYNRFDLPSGKLGSQTQTGERVHLLGHVSLPMSGAAWWLIPKLSLNSASYNVDQPLDASGRRSIGRSIPTFSIDHGWILERNTTLFGQAMRQTLEPRVLYVNTPYRDQSAMPNFDSAPRDYNFDSVFAENQFSGVDRVSDAHMVAFGATTRWIEDERGEEQLRLGMVQRYLLRNQRITPDGTPQTHKLSDVVLLASAHLNQAWWTDSTLQLNSSDGTVERTVLRLRYSPGPFRTVSASYRLARGQSEQVELAWQWPLFGPDRKAITGGAGCAGAWYGAGRLQYSMRDKRFTDSVIGAEYDSGCWILRVGAERQATGRAETNTRLILQLELVGLSPLGSNALKVLRDNIPGYRSLSSERSAFGTYD
jgi:LPS-assembly protein